MKIFTGFWRIARPVILFFWQGLKISALLLFFSTYFFQGAIVLWDIYAIPLERCRAASILCGLSLAFFWLCFKSANRIVFKNKAAKNKNQEKSNEK